jgi:hypothetical protein
MPWIEVFAVFVVSHLVGDYALQTDWQALNKRGGLTSGSATARRALLSHIFTYTLAFVPALIWLIDDLGAGILWLAALIAIPHMIQDDGKALTAYARAVNGVDLGQHAILDAALDQTFHLVALFGTALLVASS